MTCRPRCILIVDGLRCRRRACRRSGDIYVCTQHAGLIKMADIDDACRPETRRLLAFSRWETAREGQRLVDRLRRKETAA